MTKHPQRCETCEHLKSYLGTQSGDSFFCRSQGGTKPSDWIKLGRLDRDIISMVGCGSHSSRPAPPALEKIVCCSDCPCCTPTCEDTCPEFDGTAWEKGRKEAVKTERERVLELLEDLRKYANGEFNESDLSDNAREMRIHLGYENRISGIMESLWSEQEKP